MTDPTAIVPYHDPFDVLQTVENILMSDEPPGLEFQNSGQFSDNEIVDANDPFIDPYTWEFCKDLIVDNSEADHSTVCDENEMNEHEGQNCNPPSLNIGDPIQLSVWPVTQAPYTCTCCQVLREIIHTNGVETTKFEIHGRLGMICHGILQRLSDDMTDQNKEYQMFDFCKESIYHVKEFLVQYCEDRKQAGYTMLQDPLLNFYEALCAGLDWDFNFDLEGSLQESPINLGERKMNQPEAISQTKISHPQAHSNAARPTKRSLAAQRERTRKLTLKDFVAYFHLPVDNAAEELEVCSTVIKKICRRDGLSRWPYRKIKCIEKKIEERSKSLTAADDGERASARADIERLQQELTKFFSQFSNL